MVTGILPLPSITKQPDATSTDVRIVGAELGESDGRIVGAELGESDARLVGAELGESEGPTDGTELGESEGKDNNRNANASNQKKQQQQQKQNKQNEQGGGGGFFSQVGAGITDMLAAELVGVGFSEVTGNDDPMAVSKKLKPLPTTLKAALTTPTLL